MNFFQCHYHMKNNGEISASKPKLNTKALIAHLLKMQNELWLDYQLYFFYTSLLKI